MEYGIETTKALDKMKDTTRKFDVSEHLGSPEMIREYLQALDCQLSIKTG